MREKYNLIQELKQKNDELVGKKRLSLIGQGDFAGANNIMRQTMNIKHHSQHLAIDDPEFPFLYDGKENISGEFSSFYTKTDKEYEVIDICKKYNELLKGKSYFALYFLHCREDDSYIVVERKQTENLPENFGFDYNNETIDALEIGEVIPPGTMLTSSTSYDKYGNVGIGLNGRVLFAVHPAVQDDAIVVSESFAKRMVCNNVIAKTISLSENSVLLNLYGSDGKYQGLPDIGDVVTNGIIAATRTVSENRMFSDMRDISLRNINMQSDHILYGEGEVIDINVYCNNPNLKVNKVNAQVMRYYNDARWFYTKVYKTCQSIMKQASDPAKVDKEIHRWMRTAMNYLDTQAVWAWNDSVFSNIMVEILIRQKMPINVGRKITGRAGNKTVVSQIWKDEDMPYLADKVVIDENGVEHPVGNVERVDAITNPLAIINRTIPMVMDEGSVTFIADRTRKHAATLPTVEEQKEFIFDVISILNPKQGAELEELYAGLSDYKKKKFIEDCISINRDGTLRTDNGIYIRWEPFNNDWLLRDSIIKVYEKYGEIFSPYHVFFPKKKWGRDVPLGEHYVGYQYFMMLKQSGEKGFSVRSSGAISDESLPEKSGDSKSGRAPWSTKPMKNLSAINTSNCGDTLKVLILPRQIVIFCAVVNVMVYGW